MQAEEERGLFVAPNRSLKHPLKKGSKEGRKTNERREILCVCVYCMCVWELAKELECVHERKREGERIVSIRKRQISTRKLPHDSDGTLSLFLSVFSLSLSLSLSLLSLFLNILSEGHLPWGISVDRLWFPLVWPCTNACVGCWPCWIDRLLLSLSDAKSSISAAGWQRQMSVEKRLNEC